MRVDDAVRVAQAQHECILRRRGVEKAVEFVEKDVGAFRKLALGCVGADFVPHIERMLCALRLLFARELAARGKHAVLRLEVDPLRSGARDRRAGLCRARGGEAAAKAFEVLLLFLGEFAHFDWARAGVAAAAGRGTP